MMFVIFKDNKYLDAVTFNRLQFLSGALLTSASKWHFDPKKLDDSYSSQVFDSCIKKLDPGKRFFIQDDIDHLNQFRHVIDDNVRTGEDTFFREVKKTYIMRLDEMFNFCEAFFKKNDIDLFSEKVLELDFDKLTFSADLEELKDFWRKVITYRIINTYLSLKKTELSQLDKNQKSKNKSKRKKRRLTRESDENKEYKALPTNIDEVVVNKSIEKVKKELKYYFERLKGDIDKDVIEYYLDSLVKVFDVHTRYFPPQKKENFDISLSGRLEGIGASLIEEDGYIKVDKVIRGSAAWRQGDLEASDLILKVAQGDGEPVSVVGSRVMEAIKLIRGKRGKEVRLTVQKTSGEIIVIPIIRDVVIIEETYAKGVVIQDTRYKKSFGYIYLPKFYRDFQRQDARSASEDIHRLIEKLKAKWVSGIVLDLRYNEGGALKDAVEIAGAFISKGPVVQVKGRDKVKMLYDKDPKVNYDGPLVIFIDRYSASASEILAAALQDYKRAVIVGSSSYGKGTVQTFVDLDTIFFKPRGSKYGDLGSLKLTIQKFYRVSGESTQLEGVVPDIIFPNKYENEEIGEKYLDHAMNWDTTKELSYKFWNEFPLFIDTLKERSSKRIASNKGFNHLVLRLDYLKRESDDTVFTLDLGKAIQDQNDMEKRAYDYKRIQKEHDFLKINVLSRQDREKDSDWHESLKKDIYVQEVLSILNDLTELVDENSKGKDKKAYFWKTK